MEPRKPRYTPIEDPFTTLIDAAKRMGFVVEKWSKSRQPGAGCTDFTMKMTISDVRLHYREDGLGDMDDIVDVEVLEDYAELPPVRREIGLG